MNCSARPKKKLFGIFKQGQPCENEMLRLTKECLNVPGDWKAIFRCKHCGNQFVRFGSYESFRVRREFEDLYHSGSSPWVEEANSIVQNWGGKNPEMSHKLPTLSKIKQDRIHALAFSIAEPQEDIGGYLLTAVELAELSSAIAGLFMPQKCEHDRFADPPRDCNFPFCGCDPSSVATMEALEEAGLLLNQNSSRFVPRAWLWVEHDLPRGGGIFLKEADARSFANELDDVFPLFTGLQYGKEQDRRIEELVLSILPLDNDSEHILISKSKLDAVLNGWEQLK